MYRNTRRGLNRTSSYSMQITVPEYPVPSELEKVLNKHKESEMSKKSQMFSKILESLSSVKYVDLSESHYVQLLKLALYLEEYQSNEEMKKRKLFKQTIQKEKSWRGHEFLFKIHVKDLDEERPWIREGDFVDVIDTSMQISFTLKVTNVMKTGITACDDAKTFNRVFCPENVYNINFRFQNYPLRCDHWALWRACEQNVITYLFPHKSKSFVKMENATYATITMLNPNINSNPEQKQAVTNIVHKSSFPAPYILYGPPGTGKTATLVEAICQIHIRSPCDHILVCTPSNTAADEIAKRILKFIPSHNVYRIYSQSKTRSSIDEELKNCSYCRRGEKNPLSCQDIAGKAILITTLCTATRFLQMELSYKYFSYIIIDEAGQGTEADMLIPISIASKNSQLYSQIVFAGDPQQLGPTVISKLADIILGRSILERLMSYDTYQKDCHNNYNPKYITKLLHNYRSHPSIIQISNKLFYDNELIAKVPIDDEMKTTFPVIFHGVDGIEEKCSYSTSTYNYTEIDVVLKYVEDLIDNKTEFGEVSTKDIGIVTPFTLQSKKIKKILRAKDDEEKRKLDEEKLKNVKFLKKGDPDDAKGTIDIMKNDKDDEENESKGVYTENDKNVFESENENKNDDVKVDDDKIKLQNEKEKDLEYKNVVENENHKDNFEIETVDDQITHQNENGNDAKTNSDNENQIKCKKFRDINVGTVELFQGQERRIMIMTAVRSKTFFHDGKEHIGFLSNPKRFNVAMTRAQDALIVVGKPDILQKNDMWQYLLKYCIDNKSYRGSEFELRDSCNEKPDVADSKSIATTASLFKDKPFKLFILDEDDLESFDIWQTVRVFVKSEEDEGIERAEQVLIDAFEYDFEL